MDIPRLKSQKNLGSLLSALGLALGLGCGSPMDPGPEDRAQKRPPLGEPIDVGPLSNTWTWVDFPDTACDDGTPTGLALSKGSSKDLLIFLNGGGACWEYSTCYVLNTTSRGPMGRKQFESFMGTVPKGSLFDRAVAENPYRDYSMVFIPYCTGDVHGGDKVGMYRDKAFHHKGRPNLVAFLRRLAATFVDPNRVVFSGASGGGFGSALNYDLFRSYFPTGKAYLLNDSGPPFIEDDIPRLLRQAWWQAWGLDGTVGQTCPACVDDMSQMVQVLKNKFPEDRMGLLSYTRDQTIRTFYLQDGKSFEVHLQRLAKERLEGAANQRYFFVDGETHTMVRDPAKHKTKGVDLWTWLNQFMSADASTWRNLSP